MTSPGILKNGQRNSEESWIKGLTQFSYGKCFFCGVGVRKTSGVLTMSIDWMLPLVCSWTLEIKRNVFQGAC